MGLPSFLLRVVPVMTVALPRRWFGKVNNWPEHEDVDLGIDLLGGVLQEVVGVV